MSPTALVARWSAPARVRPDDIARRLASVAAAARLLPIDLCGAPTTWDAAAIAAAYTSPTPALPRPQLLGLRRRLDVHRRIGAASIEAWQPAQLDVATGFCFEPGAGAALAAVFLGRCGPHADWTGFTVLDTAGAWSPVYGGVCHAVRVHLAGIAVVDAGIRAGIRCVVTDPLGYATTRDPGTLVENLNAWAAYEAAAVAAVRRAWGDAALETADERFASGAVADAGAAELAMVSSLVALTARRP